MILDVGCGNHLYAKGDVNVDRFRAGQNLEIGIQNIGEIVDPHLIKNFVVADACHLPFKDRAFDVVFSSHLIEHVPNPFLLYKEFARVASRKVIVRCPHRRGSGAKRPFHLSYLDEAWFNGAQKRLGFKGLCFVRAYEFLSSRQVQPPTWFARSLLWRGYKRLERKFGVNVPFEIEAWLIKQNHNCNRDPIRFFTVTNNRTYLSSKLLSSRFIPKTTVSIFENTQANLPLPVVMNRFIDNYLDEQRQDCWMVFCHHDFVLKQDLAPLLEGRNVNAVYGVIGGKTSTGNLIGRIMQTDGSYIGNLLTKSEPVQTLDEMCLIIHSSLLRGYGLRFDPQFRFHFYGADFCMQAYVAGFDVYALQVDCQHKSRTIKGDRNKEYYKQLGAFAEKWRVHLPIKTTTRLITVGDIPV